MRDCESDLERFLVFERERETYGNGSIADDTTSGLIERKRETRRGITHERDRKGAADDRCGAGDVYLYVDGAEIKQVCYEINVSKER